MDMDGYAWDHELGTCGMCNAAGLQLIKPHICSCGCGYEVPGRYDGDIEGVHRAAFAAYDAAHPLPAREIVSSEVTEAFKNATKKTPDIVYQVNPFMKTIRK